MGHKDFLADRIFQTDYSDIRRLPEQRCYISSHRPIRAYFHGLSSTHRKTDGRSGVIAAREKNKDGMSDALVPAMKKAKKTPLQPVVGGLDSQDSVCKETGPF